MTENKKTAYNHGMKPPKGILIKVRAIAAVIFFGLLCYFSFITVYDFVGSFLTGMIVVLPILFFKYAISLLSKLTRPLETLPNNWSDDLLQSFADLMADPAADEITDLTLEIRRNNLDRADAKAIFEGPLTMVSQPSGVPQVLPWKI